MKTDESQIRKIVRSYYSKNAEGEWRRLKRDAYHQIEFTITMHFIHKYLPKRGLVLDADGGPGRYTIELARKGYDIILVDLVPEMLKTAEKQIKRADVKKRVKQLIEGSVDDLSAFADETFDAVLCLGGPLNHMLDARRREQAVTELVRVARPDAPVIASVISRIGLLRTILTYFPHEMKYAMHHWRVGDYVPGLQGEGFTATHWFLPEELQALMQKHGVETLEMAGLEGLSTHQRRATNKLAKDTEKWKMWTQILLETCTDPSVVGSCEHFLSVGRKRG